MEVALDVGPADADDRIVQKEDGTEGGECDSLSPRTEPTYFYV